MTGTELFYRFYIALVIGMAGLGVFMNFVFEGLLSTWDPAVAARHFWRELAVNRNQTDLIGAAQILTELEARRGGYAATKSTERALERRANALRDEREAERRLAASIV